ncbi:MAG: glycosyl hydrolase [Verrucomicrobiia bacterium]
MKNKCKSLKSRNKFLLYIVFLSGFLLYNDFNRPLANPATSPKDSPAFAETSKYIRVGLGGYSLKAPETGRTPPSTIYKSASINRPIPSNKWWSSLLWEPFSNNMYPHPLAVGATEKGLKIYYPGAAITAGKNIINGGMPGGGDDFIVGLEITDKFSSAVVDGFGDWSVSALFESGDKRLRATMAMGSPFVFFAFAGDIPLITFKNRPKVANKSQDESAIKIAIANKLYGFFAPSNSKWDISANQLKLISPDKKQYFSVAILPDSDADTFELFKKYAHNHITNTLVEWSFDEDKAIVKTRFIYQLQQLEGNAKGTLFALYPHQWLNTTNPLTDKFYNSVRGIMKLGAGTEFITEMVFPSALPMLPIAEKVDRLLLKQFIDAELKQSPRLIGDTYWLGKQLGKWTSLLQISRELKYNQAVETFSARIKSTLENFFVPTNQSGNLKSAREGVFYYDRNWGTFIGYPASYGSDDQLNDHHFHYGYFIRAAAEITFINPEWGKDSNWGGMVKMLIRDIANPDRSDVMFPVLRNFDVYAGHSWASGHSRFADGNNNESSSEAVNAWYALILFGEAIGDRALRDLGIWLFTTEIEAINHYWFDVTHRFHHPDYGASVVTMVWGGKGVNETWFSNNPEMVHGINFLPLTAASLYLGRYPEYCEKNYRALVSEKKAFLERRGKKFETDPEDSSLWDSWADIILMYRALSNPQDAMNQFDERLNNLRPEAGNSLANTYVWLCFFNQFGTVERSLTANTPYYAVLKKEGRLTYIGYNPANSVKEIKFSDNTVLVIPPRSFAIK